jgi:hypothetical protein
VVLAAVPEVGEVLSASGSTFPSPLPSVATASNAPINSKRVILWMPDWLK